MAVAATGVCVGPMGYCGGQPYHLGTRPDCPHATSQWFDDVAVTRTALVIAACTIGYVAPMRVGKVGVAHRVSAVVAIMTCFVMLHALTLTRRVEVAEAERTGWGIWSCVPYIFACISYIPK